MIMRFVPTLVEALDADIGIKDAVGRVVCFQPCEWVRASASDAM